MGKVAEIERTLGKHVAPNYRPLSFAPLFAKGEWIYALVKESDGSDSFRHLLDLHSMYSAANLGHNHPDVVELEIRRLEENRPSLVPRGLAQNSELAELSEMLSNLCGMDMIMPKNSGYEGFDVAVKAARKWAYERKGVPQDNAEIIVCGDSTHSNFHGRGEFAVDASTDPSVKEGFGPHGPKRAFKKIPFGNIRSLKRAITSNTAAFIVEPIQAEAGILIPPDGYLAEARRLCKENNVLFILDEIQTGLGRTGKLFAWQHDGEGARPDGMILGKALGFITSAFVSSEEVLGVLTEGTEGSTFGGNPKSCAIAVQNLKLLSEPSLLERVERLGEEFMERLRVINSPLIKEVRGKGFLMAVELTPEAGGARRFYEALFREGILAVKRHENVLGLSPSLIINEHNLLLYAVEKIRKVFETIDKKL